MTVILYLEFLTGLFNIQLTSCIQLTNIYLQNIDFWHENNLQNS